MRLLPTMALEPPPRYVAFVAAHLDPLREQAAGVTGGEDEAEQLYPQVLEDVAARWRWLEVLCRWLRRPHAADRYLRRAFARRCRRWREETGAGAADELPDIDVRVWTAEELWTGPRPQPRRVRSSGATRIAAFVRPEPDDPTGLPEPERVVLAEAALAWWHAFEANRRRRAVAWAVAGVLLIGLLIRLHDVTG